MVEELILGDGFHLYGGVFGLVQLVVDEVAHNGAVYPPKQGDDNNHAQEGEWPALDETFAKLQGEVVQGAVVGYNHPGNDAAIYAKGEEYPPDAFGPKGAAEHVPVVVDEHQHPDAEAVGEDAHDAIEPGDGEDGKGYVHEEPNEVESAHARTDEQEVDEPVALDGQQQVGLDFLCGRLLSHATKQEVEHEHKDEAGVHDVVGFDGTSAETQTKQGAEEYQVAGPEDGHEHDEVFGKLAFVVHGVALAGQLAMATKFEK